MNYATHYENNFYNCIYCAPSDSFEGWNHCRGKIATDKSQVNVIFHFFIIKPTRCTNFTKIILAWNCTCFGQFLCLSSGVHSPYTQQWCMSYRFVDSIRAGPAARHHCWVYSEWTPDDGQRNCLKHVEFHAKINFAKLVHLVGVIIMKKFVTLHGHTNVKFVSFHVL